MKKYKCLICGEIFEVADDDPQPMCPVCGAEGNDLKLIEEK